MKALRGKFSNSRYGQVGAAIVILSLPIAYLLQKQGHLRAGIAVGFLAFGVFWALCGIGQMLTGFAWKNLAEGARGAHRAENPKEFWTAVGICGVGAGASWAAAIFELLKQ